MYLQSRLITEDSACGDQVLKKLLLTKMLPKGKGRVAVHVIQTWGSGGIALHILYLCARWR